jgi:hypothetical protein
MENKVANNLVELCRQLRATTSGKTNEESFNILQKLVGRNIKIRYEVTGKNTSDQVDNNDKAPEKKREQFAHLNGLNVSRVLLTTNRAKANFARELIRTCNGVVLEYPSWKVLSVPAPMFNLRFRMTDVVNNIDSYSIYEIKDGTTVTLYWYGEKWCMSSTNGFDVSDYEWMGPTPYMKALTAITKMYPDFSFDKLDRDRTYTVGFRHHEFHPLLSDSEKMWLIQSCDLNALNAENPSLDISLTTNIGIPLQTNATFSGLRGSRLFDMMCDKNNNAFMQYMSTIRTSQPEIHYGYVLRSDSTDNYVSNVMLESELLKKVRTLMYNLPKRTYAEAVPVTAINRLKYTILRAYLSCPNKYDFLNLFPQFTEQYRTYDTLFSKLSNRIISALRNRNTRNTITDSAFKNARSDMNARIDKLAFSLVKHIEDCGRINAMDPQGPNIVLDFMMDRKHLDLYYTYLFSD